MKYLTEFENWSNEIVTEFTKPKKKSSLALDQDPATQAQIERPDLDPDEALSAYIAKKLGDMERRDLEQNKIINAQSKANNSLKSELSTLAKNFKDVEQDSEETQSELDRLKSLSGQLKSGQESRKLNSDEIAQLLDQVKELQTKPGMTDERYEELKKQVTDFKNGGVNPTELEKLRNNIEQLSQQKSVDTSEFERIKSLADRVAAAQQEVEKGRGDIAAKLADIEQRQAEVEKREETHNQQVKDEVEKEIKRADDKRKRSARTSYETSKKRLDALEPKVDKIEPKVNRIEPEIKKQNDVNSEQDIEIQRQDAINNIQDKLLSKLASGERPEQTKVDPSASKDFKFSFPADRLSDREQKDSFNIEPTYTPLKNRDYEFETEINRVSDRIENLLANIKPDGKEKTEKEKSEGLIKVQIEIKKLVNDLEGYLINEYDTVTPDVLADVKKKTMDYMKPYLQYWSKQSGKEPSFFVKNINFDKSTARANKNKADYDSTPRSPTASAEYYDHISSHKWRDQLDQLKKRRDATHNSRLPESLISDINSLVENILGAQYSKYLK